MNILPAVNPDPDLLSLCLWEMFAMSIRSRGATGLEEGSRNRNSAQ
jgi:hypothetical protein